MQPSTSRILACIRSVLAHDVASELSSPRALAQLRLVDLALRELSSRASGKKERLVASYRRQRELAEHGRQLLASAGTAGPTTVGGFETDNSLAIMTSWEQVQEACDAVRGELAELIESMIPQLRHATTDNWATQGRLWIETVIRDELGTAAEASMEDHGDGVTDEPLPDLNSDRAQLYFCGKLHLAQPTKLAVEKISGGFSRETYLLRTPEARGPDSSWIIRKEKPGGLMENIALVLRDEYAIVNFLFEQGLPVPRPLWFESDESLLQGPFAVVERAAGEVLGSAVKISALDESAMHDIAHVLARLHTTPWQEQADKIYAAFHYPTAEPLSARAAFDISLSRWKAFVRQKGVVSPATTAGLQWLGTNFPAGRTPLCLLHGDFGLHNMLFQEGRLTALLDWEHACLGDPARDLVQIRRQLREFVPWSRFMDWYREAGGPDVTEEVLSYFEVYSSTNAVITMQVALESQFEVQSPPQIKYLELGLDFMPHYARLFAATAQPIWE